MFSQCSWKCRSTTALPRVTDQWETILKYPIYQGFLILKGFWHSPLPLLWVSTPCCCRNQIQWDKPTQLLLTSWNESLGSKGKLTSTQTVKKQHLPVCTRTAVSHKVEILSSLCQSALKEKEASTVFSPLRYNFMWHICKLSHHDNDGSDILLIIAPRCLWLFVFPMQAKKKMQMRCPSKSLFFVSITKHTNSQGSCHF